MRATVGLAMRVLVVDGGIMQAIDGGRGWTTRGRDIDVRKWRVRSGGRPDNGAMTLDHDACYRALATHDARFDGRFFVGVRSTGIYCRPVCTVRSPRKENCRFYPSAAAAEAAGFRPVPALPARARTRLRGGRCVGAHRAGGDRHDRRRLPREPRHRGPGRAHRHHEPPLAPRLRGRARRRAGRVRADAAAAAREAAAHRHRAAGDRRRVRERLCERAPA